MSTTAFVDFAKLKEDVKIEQVVQMLGLKMKANGAQLRGECPTCRSRGDRALAVNTEKNGGSFYCFACKGDRKVSGSGDSIALCSHITGKSPREAAQQIATHFKFVGAENAAKTTGNSGDTPRKTGFDATAYLKGLDATAPELKDIGVSPETLTEWRAGYCKTGIMRGKLAIALSDREGNVLGFCGRSLDGSTPSLTFPNGISPKDIIFGADRIGEGEVRLLRDPIEVMQASEVGEPAVCLLTDTVEAQQLEQLASLLDIKKAHIIL